MFSAELLCERSCIVRYFYCYVRNACWINGANVLCELWERFGAASKRNNFKHNSFVCNSSFISGVYANSSASSFWLEARKITTRYFATPNLFNHMSEGSLNKKTFIDWMSFSGS